MGVIDNIDNKLKLRKSEKNEMKDIGNTLSNIDDATEAATEQMIAIGQYFWQLYINGEYEPVEGNKVFFENLDALNESVGNMAAEIENRKIEGTQERERINEETRRKVQDKEARKAERAEDRARAREFRDSKRL